jgi:YD repeat-containing protein
MVYDQLGHKVQITDPDMGIWTYQYDPAGNLVRQGNQG